MKDEKSMHGKSMTGAGILWECLEREGVKVVFGYPGGAILPAYDALKHSKIHHVLVRHEQGATHMADGFARASGQVGVAVATSGPGATNMVTGIATAMLDSSPIVCITGQVGSKLIGSDAFQETDITGVTLPITKHNYLVTHASEVARTIREAFYVARSGRPGPVLVDITKDAQQTTCEFDWEAAKPQLPGYRPDLSPAPSEYAQALELIHNSKRPVILAGHGIIISGAMAEVREFAERAGIPVALTLLGIGSFPAAHPLNLGMMGMHGEAWVNHTIQEADLLLAFGMRFDDRVTGNLKTYASNAKKIHIEIDPAEINKNVKVDVPLVGDLREVLHELLPKIESIDRSEWLDSIDKLKGDAAVRDIQNLPDSGHLYAAHVINDLWRETRDGDTVVVTDVGQHQMWEAQYYKHEKARSLITSGGLGIVQENLKVNIAIINNGFLGMVRQWQEFFYERNYAATPLLNPDFAKLGEAYGIRSMTVTERSQVVPSVRAAREHDGPVLINFRVEQEDTVYPMVAAGASLHEMIRRPSKIVETAEDE
jgi:acetolactate synthase-1/2/3 large subunit